MSITVLIEMDKNGDPLIVTADQVRTYLGVRFAEHMSVDLLGKPRLRRWKLSKDDSHEFRGGWVPGNDCLGDRWPVSYQIFAGGTMVESWDDLSDVDLYELDGQANQ